VQGTDGNTGTYEVWARRKGDVARAILYMDVRYEGGTAANGQPEPDLIVTNNRAQIVVTPSGQVPAQGYMGVLSTLLAWHNADPPDAQEQLRNAVVYSYQGNRNPFIDHPEYAACLWQNVCNAPPPDAVFANGFE
jgi:endonuclease I